MKTSRANQDEIFDTAIEKSRTITLFLKSGVPIRGKVVDHDPYTVFLQTEKSQTLVYKHSITSLFPARQGK